jgi:hypothetical protein
VSKCCFASNSGATSALAGSHGFAQSAPMALQRITDAGNRSLILILSDINMHNAPNAHAGACQHRTWAKSSRNWSSS